MTRTIRQVRQCRHCRTLLAQRGALALMFAVAISALLLLIGMALDLAQIYTRKAELQRLANATALAAAHELNGTAAGVARARAAAAAAASALRYQYDRLPVPWSDAALQFGATAAAHSGSSRSSSSGSAVWRDAASAEAAPDGLLYARVDTTALVAALGRVPTVWTQLLSSVPLPPAGAYAVAGRLTIAATPLALCALSATPAAARINPGPPPLTELVEYGFRRGVAYDLMQLNAGGLTPQHYAIDPLSPPGHAGAASNTAPSVLAAYVCAGMLQIPRLQGAHITVQRGFPLASLYRQLNSRFDQYVGAACNPNGAPPDANIKAYPYTSIPWMSTPRNSQTARSYHNAALDQLYTVADPLSAPAGTVNADFGPLWSYARAVPYAAYVAGAAEPAGGYRGFTPSQWSTLYPSAITGTSGAPAASGYPALSPYQVLIGPSAQAPSADHLPGQRGRRVLNVALLACPVAAGSMVPAQVLAIAKFFMTVPASATSLPAEFAGTVADQALGGATELLP